MYRDHIAYTGDVDMTDMTEMNAPNLIDIQQEIDRFFTADSLVVAEPPTFVLLLGGVCSGRTTIRRQQYTHGYVVLDAAEIFLNLSCGRYYDFPSVLEVFMEAIGSEVAMRAVREKRPIVSEMIGANPGVIEEVTGAMLKCGYRYQVVFVTADVEEAWKRNVSRASDNISAHVTEPYHRRWLLRAGGG